MDQIKESINFNQVIQIDLLNFASSLLVAIILSFFVQITYNRTSKTLSNQNNFSRIFILLCLTTTIIITIIKSSLALSLGLVGALSIVRFRAAIKEPEELVYLFLVIAVGLGCGANQLIITTVGIIFALILIVIYSGYAKNSRKEIEQIINLGVIIEQDISDKQINNLISEIKKISTDLKFISMSRTSNNTTINLDVKPNKFQNLTTLSEKIKNKFKNSKVIMAYNDDLSL